MRTVKDFLADFRTQSLRTARVVRLFEDKDLNLKPGPGSMSTAEQVNHICASRNFIKGLLNEDNPSAELFMRQFDVNTSAKALAALKQSADEVLGAGGGMTDEKWQQKLAPWGPEYNWPREKMCYVMIEHEGHHNGQLHVYARVVGKVPVMLYHPVDESVYNL